MRSFLRSSGGAALASGTSPAALATSARCVFSREAWTPVTLQGPNEAAAPVPARLCWLYRSTNPRHLALSLRAPAVSPTPLTTRSSFEDLDTGAEREAGDDRAAAGTAAPSASAAASYKPEDFIYGRLFLRPYNVAQLLTVLQGWSDAPALIERPRSSLRLGAVPLPDEEPRADTAQAAAEQKSGVAPRLASSSFASPLSSSSSSVAAGKKPRAVQLTARFTRKALPQKSGGARNGATAAGSVSGGAASTLTPRTDVDPFAVEDYPDSIYLEGEMGTVRAVLREEDLVLLTSHLESVLSDFFGMEHRAVQSCVDRAVERDEWSDRRGGPCATRDRYYGHEDRRSTHRPSTNRSRPRYHSQTSHAREHQQVTSEFFEPHATAASRTTAAAAAAAAATATIQAQVNELFGAADAQPERESESAAAGSVTSATPEAHPAFNPTLTPAPADSNTAEAATAAEEEEEYEEIVEEVEEEMEDGEEAAAAQQQQPRDDSTYKTPAQERGETEDSSASVPAEEVDDLLDAEVDLAAAEPATTASPTAYAATHHRDSGEMTLDAADGYATGRFVRDGGVRAAEVQEVRKVGDFDVLRRTQQAEGSVERAGTRTTVQATNTTGAFRSASGAVTGTFAYQRVSTATVSATEEVVAAAAAATAVPVHRADVKATTNAPRAPLTATPAEAEAEGKYGDKISAEPTDVAGPTLEVKATSVKEVVSEEEEAADDGAAEEEEVEEEATTAKERPKRKRTTGGSKKKKGGKKKTKKAARRKSSSKGATPDSSAETMAF